MLRFPMSAGWLVLWQLCLKEHPFWGCYVISFQLAIIHSTIAQPNTNGKKERAHRDDKRDFWNGINSNNISYIRKKNEEYVVWRNNVKGHWALGGKPSAARLEENRKPVVNYAKEDLEKLAEAKI